MLLLMHYYFVLSLNPIRKWYIFAEDILWNEMQFIKRELAARLNFLYYIVKLTFTT
jgi:hypothetical protein